MRKIVLLGMQMMLFVPLFFSSCSKDEQIENEKIVEEAKIETHSLSQKDAVDIAISALNSLEQEANTISRMKSHKWKVREIQTYGGSISRSNSGNNKLFYIINFEGGGFAIVINDDRIYPAVYGMSSKGVFDLNDESAQYIMSLATITTWKAPVNYPNGGINPGGGMINPNPNLKPNGSQEKPHLTPNYPNQEDPTNYPKQKIDGKYYYVKEEINERTTPYYYLSTLWSQGAPYNKYCFTSKGEQAVVGCVAVAMAQVMTYYRRPVLAYKGHTYLWKQMLQDSIITEKSNSETIESVANLMHDVGVAVGMNYGVKASSAHIGKVPPFLRQMGLSAMDKYHYNGVDDILFAIEGKCPVIMSGNNGVANGHAWIVDGYYKEQKTVTLFDIDTKHVVDVRSYPLTYYLHCNWGWGGDENGYFQDKLFEIPQFGDEYDFTQNMYYIGVLGVKC